MASKHRFCVYSLRCCQCSDLEVHRHVVNEKNRRDGFAEATKGPRRPSDFFIDAVSSKPLKNGSWICHHNQQNVLILTPRFHDDRLLWFSTPLWSGCARTLLFK